MAPLLAVAEAPAHAVHWHVPHQTLQVALVPLASRRHPRRRERAVGEGPAAAAAGGGEDGENGGEEVAAVGGEAPARKRRRPRHGAVAARRVARRGGGVRRRHVDWRHIEVALAAPRAEDAVGRHDVALAVVAHENQVLAGAGRRAGFEVQGRVDDAGVTVQLAGGRAQVVELDVRAGEHIGRPALSAGRVRRRRKELRAEAGRLDAAVDVDDERRLPVPRFSHLVGERERPPLSHLRFQLLSLAAADVVESTERND